MNIDRKIAIVTGGANGIGKTIVKYLHNEGAFVYIADIDSVNGERVYSELGNLVSEIYFKQCDVRDDGNRKNLVDSVIESSDHIDILINNAGGALQSERDYRKDYRGNFVEYDLGIYQPTFELNLFAPIAMMNLVIPHMIRNEGGGSIINISSVNAVLPLELPAYSSAKAALELITKLYARQYGKYGVRINAIRSGPVMTDDTLRAYENDPQQKETVLSMISSRRIGTTDDVARTVLSLIQNDAFVGSIVTVDGGFVLDTPFFRMGEK